MFERICWGSCRDLIRVCTQTYWSKIDWALNKQTGVGVVQGITIPEASKFPFALVTRSRALTGCYT